MDGPHRTERESLSTCHRLDAFAFGVQLHCRQLAAHVSLVESRCPVETTPWLPRLPY
jgi:hypothetical protein